MYYERKIKASERLNNIIFITKNDECPALSSILNWFKTYTIINVKYISQWRKKCSEIISINVYNIILKIF